VSVHTEYSVDYLSRVSVGAVGVRDVVTLLAETTVSEARSWFTHGGGKASHQGFPIVDRDGSLVGVLTRRDILSPTIDVTQPLGELIRRAPVVVFTDNTLRDAADQMVLEAVGRLPVVRRENPRQVVGILSRSDLLAAHAPRLREARDARRMRGVGLTDGLRSFLAGIGSPESDGDKNSPN
jgi:CIC family chloride channel protein